MLTQENNALKNILKDAVIVYDDDNMRQVSMTSLGYYDDQLSMNSHMNSDWPINSVLWYTPGLDPWATTTEKRAGLWPTAVRCTSS